MLDRTLVPATVADPVLGVDYDLIDGRIVPLVSGGDEPTEPTDLAALIRLVETAEGDLSAVTDADELAELRTGLADGYRDTRGSVTDATGLAALRRVAAALARVRDREAELAAAAGEIEAGLAELDAEIGETDETASDDETEEAETEEETSDEETEAETEETADASGETEAVEEAQQIAASGLPAVPATLPSLTALRRTQRADAAPTPRPDADEAAGSRVLAFAGLQRVGGGQEFAGIEQLGEELANLATAVRVARPSSTRKHYVGKVEAVRSDNSRLVFAADHDGMDDEGIIDLAVRRNREIRLAAASIQASGGTCVPPRPDYRIDTIGDRGTPFVESLPTVIDNRPLSYFPWLEFDINSAPLASGIGIVTDSQDAAGYGGTNFAGVTTPIPVGGHAFKDCVRIDCPELQTCELEAIYRCVTVGRFQAISFPEYVRVFDNWTGIYFDVARDQAAMAKVLAAAKTITAGPATFGATRDLLGRIRQLVAHIRSARRSPGLVIRVYLPWFASYMLANDIAFSFAQGTENLRVSPEQVLGILASTEGIIIDTYNVSAGTTADGSPTVLELPTDGAPLPAWPTQMRVLAWADGAVFHQSAGNVSFGLQEVGMHTNDFSTFEETFETTCTRGTDIYAMDVDLCDSGIIGGSVVKTCGDVPGDQNEIQSIAIDATGGDFIAGFDGAETGDVAWNASAAVFQAALEATPVFAPGDVAVTKTGSTFFVQFTGQYAGQNVPVMTTDATGLTGGASTATVAVVQNGGG